MNLFKKLFTDITPTKRTFYFVVADGILFILSVYISYALKFGIKHGLGDLPYLFIFNAIPLFLIVKYTVFFRLHLYQFTWQFTGLNDLYNIIKALLISSSIIFLIYIIGYSIIPSWLPKSVILTDFFISVILIGFLRISKRMFVEIFKPTRINKGKSTIIIGAGSTGEMIVRDLRKSNFETYNPVAFLDRTSQKWNTYLHNIPVLGDISILKSTVKKFDVKSLIIADHSISQKDVRELFTTARGLEIDDIKVVPKLFSMTNAEVTLKKLEDIHVEDLINRQEIWVETEKIGQFLHKKCILITGGAGSIGAEIVRQVVLFNPSKVIIFEIDETEIFHLEQELERKYPELMDNIISIVGDIRDKEKVNAVFQKYRPDIVFSTAAYKHVPMMEKNADEAVKVNILGTYNLCEAADQSGTMKFINISTDKAVKPQSIMGMTKRLSEYIVQAFNEKSDTQYISVRFGNVLGSRGSVIPIFLEQIQQGGPVTVTHKDMKRYFMTISEAVTLVLQASLIGNGGEVMVLDMGEPIYIYQIAEELIKLHGFEPGEDIDIIYTGIRKGENIFEEILTAEEGTNKTNHERIYIAVVSKKYEVTEIRTLIDEVYQILFDSKSSDDIKKYLLEKLNINKKD